MLRTTTRTTRRAGFTLVELMVSAAVCILIMAILSQAFVISTQTMREMKAVGELRDQLRAAGVVIREDLGQNHFLPQDSAPNKGLKLADQRLDGLTLMPAPTPPYPAGTFRLSGWAPPQTGFFRVRSDPTPGSAVVDEGLDNDGLRSYRAGNHYLHFTSVKTGGRDQDTYSAVLKDPLNPNILVPLTSPAAEIAYFLDPNPTGSTGGIPTFNLVRRQRLVALNGLDIPKFQQRQVHTTADAVAVLSMFQGTNGPEVNTMYDLPNPGRRMGGAGGTLNAAPVGAGNDYNLSASVARPGDDVLLSNVISFQVQLLYPNVSNNNGAASRDFMAGPTATAATENTDGPFDFIRLPLPANASHNSAGGMDYTFDTWSTAVPNWDIVPPNGRSATALPQRFRVTGVRIVLRVWDPKLKIARQMAIVQDL